MSSFIKAATLVLLALMMPFSSSAIFTENTVIYPKEVIISSDEIWTAESWNELSSRGFVPLRQISPNEVLAWGAYGDEAGAADWRPGLEKLYPEGLTRILLEPRLPAEGVSSVISKLEGFGFDYDFEFLPSENSAMPARIIVDWSGQDLRPVLYIPGILWVEPVLETSARNEIAAGIMSSGLGDSKEMWDLGLNGSGVTIAFADSGIDRDHACFRNGGDGGNITGIPGINHRKITMLNESLDDWDNLSHQNGGHGTHVAGTLGCWFEGASVPNDSTSLSHAAKLVVQDIVGPEGWVPPDVDWLLWEGAREGAVIHSDSWGDDTVEYTARTYDFDAWASEVPWSVAFIAPGNNAGQIMEPANARSVVAVSVATKTDSHGLWEYSSVGETHDGRRGIHIAAPGASIVSAAADNFHESWNNDTRLSTGSSMATPAAASFSAIVQQMIEEGRIGEGNFTPSGPMLRAAIALAAEAMPGLQHDRGVTGLGPDNVQGWGRANLSRLVDLDDPMNNDVWLWDTYAMNSWQSLVENRIIESNIDSKPLERVGASPWDGSGAVGPFLSSGEVASWTLNRSGGDLDVRLSWSPRPEPAQIDDLQLIVETSDGRFVYGDIFEEDGFSKIFNSEESFSPRNETSVGIRISEIDLEGVEWVNISVNARFVNVGNHSNMLGLNGDSIGFGLIAKGVSGERIEVFDLDGDGIGDDIDTDDDSDGVSDAEELGGNPPTNASNPDTDGDGWCDGPIAVNLSVVCKAGPDAFPLHPEAYLDTDGDGFPDIVLDGDSELLEDLDDDGDDWSDIEEIMCQTDGLDFTNVPSDFDDDRVCDLIDLDDDGDGFSDQVEVSCQSNPLNHSDRPTDLDEDGICGFLDLDDDDDGLVDFLEKEWGTNPNLTDSDDDGLSDGDEVLIYNTEPLENDTDGDGVNDGEEVALGTDPLIAPEEKIRESKEEVGVPGFLFVSVFICLAIAAITSKARRK